MEIPITLTLDLALMNSAVADPNGEGAKRELYLRVNFNEEGTTPNVVISLPAFFASWFVKDPEDLNEFWKAEQFAMERFLEGQLQAVRRRLMKKGIYPSQ